MHLNIIPDKFRKQRVKHSLAHLAQLRVVFLKIITKVIYEHLYKGRCVVFYCYSS